MGLNPAWELNKIAEYKFCDWLQVSGSGWCHPVEYFLRTRKGRHTTRWLVFKEKGFACVTCGIAADRVIEWQEFVQVGTHHKHIDLFAITPKGNLVMLTVDHIVPKSKGGDNTMKNLQPMCHVCNETKADNLETPPSISLS